MIDGFLRLIVRLLVFVLSFYTSFALANVDQEALNKEAILAIKADDFELVRTLLGKGLNPNYELGSPGNVMRMAAHFGRNDILSIILDFGGNPDHQFDEGMYFINSVASQGNDVAFKMLIDQGVDLDRLMYFDQFTAFTGLLRYMDVDLLRYVLNYGVVDVNYIPPNGYSALYRAYVINECGLVCLEVFLEHCADPSLPIKFGEMSFEEYVVLEHDVKALDIIEINGCSD